MAEDRKFKFEDGHFVNRVSGEAIPDDEPVIIFRARDRHALQVLYHYQQLCSDEHHQRAIEDRIQEFQAFRDTHPLKEPGVTRHIVLNSELGEAATAGKSGEDAPSQHADARLRALEEAARVADDQRAFALANLNARHRPAHYAGYREASIQIAAMIRALALGAGER